MRSNDSSDLEELPRTPAPDAEVPPDIQKAALEAFGNLVEQMGSNQNALYQESRRRVNQPKSWFADPFALLDSLGMGYRTNPSFLTYDMLRMMSEKDSIVAAIISTRIQQCFAFTEMQADRFHMGFRVVPRFGERDRKLSKSEQDRVKKIQMFLLQTGRDNNADRDDFGTFVKKLVRDRLTYDQGTFEKVKTLGGEMHSFYATPSEAMRLAHPKFEHGEPLDVRELKTSVRYIQLNNGQIVREFTSDELAFLVANPRTHMKVYGYGFPEMEILTTTVTSHLWAEEWNRRAFSQGSTIKGVLNIKGNVDPKQFEAFKRQWTAQVAGVTNAWRTPLLNSEGLEFTPMAMSNTEMGYQMWMEYLVKIASAIYLIDPAEINFDLRGGAGQQPVFMSQNEAQQKVSKDRGLQPLLRYLSDAINKHIVWNIDSEFSLSFLGLDAKTEDQQAALRQTQATTTLTIDEARALDGREPLKKGGDIILNPAYTGWLTQQQQAQQMQQQPGGAPGGAPPGGPPQPGQDPNQQPGQEPPAFNQPPGQEEKQGKQALLAAHGQQEQQDKDQEKNKWRDLRDFSKSALIGDLTKSDQPIYDTLDGD